MMKIRKLSSGNYFGNHNGHYFFIYRRLHPGWCVRIGKNGEWLYGEGFHSSCLRDLHLAKNWVIGQLVKPRKNETDEI